MRGLRQYSVYWAEIDKDTRPHDDDIDSTKMMRH